MSVRFGLRLAVLSCALFGIAATALAQTKVGVISLQRAVLESAEIKKASADMEAKYRPRQQEMEKLQRDLQALQQQLQTNADKLTAQAASDLNAQSQRKQRDLQRMNDDLQADVERDRNEILSKSSQKMQSVVQKLAEAKGLDVVVDTTSTVFFKPAIDLTAEAVAAYDKAYPAK